MHANLTNPTADSYLAYWLSMGATPAPTPAMVQENPDGTSFELQSNTAPANFTYPSPSLPSPTHPVNLLIEDSSSLNNVLSSPAFEPSASVDRADSGDNFPMSQEMTTLNIFPPMQASAIPPADLDASLSDQEGEPQPQTADSIIPLPINNYPLLPGSAENAVVGRALSADEAIAWGTQQEWALREDGQSSSSLKNYGAILFDTLLFTGMSVIPNYGLWTLTNNVGKQLNNKSWELNQGYPDALAYGLIASIGIPFLGAIGIGLGTDVAKHGYRSLINKAVSYPEGLTGALPTYAHYASLMGGTGAMYYFSITDPILATLAIAGADKVFESVYTKATRNPTAVPPLETVDYGNYNYKQYLLKYLLHGLVASTGAFLFSLPEWTRSPSSSNAVSLPISFTPTPNVQEIGTPTPTPVVKTPFVPRQSHPFLKAAGLGLLGTFVGRNSINRTPAEPTR